MKSVKKAFLSFKKAFLMSLELDQSASNVLRMVEKGDCTDIRGYILRVYTIFLYTLSRVAR